VTDDKTESEAATQLQIEDDIFNNDTVSEVIIFLKTMRLTENVRLEIIKAFAETYKQITHSTLSWGTTCMFLHNVDMFKLQMLELKCTLTGSDADSLLFGDFDIAVEALAERLKLYC
jgi:hypothetical protein